MRVLIDEQKAILTLGKDAELKELNESQVLIFTGCSNRSWKDKHGERKEKNVWFSCEQYFPKGKTIKTLPHLKKGADVLVSGQVEQRVWLDKEGSPKGEIVLRIEDLTITKFKNDN